MIFWSGKGLLTLVVLVLGIAVSQGVYEVMTGLKPPQQDGDPMWAFAFLIGAIANFALAKYLDKKPKRIVIDKETGQEFELRGTSSLFLVPVRK